MRLQDAGYGLQDADAYKYVSFMHLGKVKEYKKFRMFLPWFRLLTALRSEPALTEYWQKMSLCNEMTASNSRMKGPIPTIDFLALSER